MAQVTVYLPEDVIQEARERARSEGRSLSAWVADLVRRETKRKEWAKSLVDVLTRGEANLVESDDPPPEDIEAFP